MDRPLPELPGVEHRFVDAGGLRVHVAEAGSGDPLVLQHGWPQHWLAWSKLIPALAEDYRVICPDLRGLGWSDAPPEGYEKEQLASDLLALHRRARASSACAWSATTGAASPPSWPACARPSASSASAA